VHPETIDIAANLTAKAFAGDLQTVLRRAREAGVVAMVAAGTTVEDSARAAALARDYHGLVWSTAGVHPHYVAACDDATVRALRQLAADPVVVAVGECGLDFFRDLSPRPVQEHWFAAQLELGCETGLPLYMHERDAHDRFLALVREHRPHFARGVVHCFTGDGEALRAYLDLDLHIGITGWICDERRGATLQQIVRDVPEDRLMLETDSPYLIPRTMTPRPKSGRNEPAFLPWVLEAVARCRRARVEDVAASTTRVARAFFGLGGGGESPPPGPVEGAGSGRGAN